MNIRSDKMYRFLLGGMVIMLLNACGNKTSNVESSKVSVVKQNSDEVLADFIADDAITIVFRGTIGEFSRASVEIIEKGSTGAAVTICMDDTIFTVHNAIRNAHMETFSYEKGDTLLALSLQSGEYGLKKMIGNIHLGKEKKYKAKLYQDLIYTSAYPINRFNGVSDIKVAASVRYLQQVILAKDREAFAALCEWPFSYRGMEVKDATALKRIPLEELFHEDFITKVAKAYDYFFYREAETGWYSLGHGFLWFIVKSDGSIRIKSVTHSF